MDYKYRIKNHQSEYDPAAWSKMSQLLEEVPEKKRSPFWRRFGWLFLLLLFLGITGVWAVQRWGNSPKISSELKSDHQTTPNTISKTQAEESAETTPLKKQRSTVNNTLTTSTSEAQTSKAKSANQISTNNLQNIKTKTESNYNAMKSPKGQNQTGSIPPLSVEDAMAKTTVPTTSLTTKHEREKESSETSKSSSQVATNDQPAIDKTDPTLESTLLQRSNLLPIDLPVLVWEAPEKDQEEKSHRKIQPLQIKKRKFFLAAGAGWASFNGNPGLHFELGTYYAASKIIGFELNTAYHFGKDRQVYIIEPNLRDNERQLDFNFLIHLNLLNTFRHRLAILPGAGYTFYNGTRRIEAEPPRADERKSKGYNFSGSLEYNYRLNPSIILGIKLGTTAYDDAVNYINFKIYKSL